LNDQQQNNNNLAFSKVVGYAVTPSKTAASKVVSEAGSEAHREYRPARIRSQSCGQKVRAISQRKWRQIAMQASEFGEIHAAAKPAGNSWKIQ
jgi:hypothetical protein